MIGINSQFLKGALVGAGAAAGGYFIYKKNQEKIENFLRNQGINIPDKNQDSFTGKSLEELVLAKEKLEDVIAEKELELKKESD